MRAHRIGLEQVVRPHARADEPAEERREDVRVVVHACEEHALVHHREARVDQAHAHAASDSRVSSFG